MEELNKLISIEISLRSLESIIKTKKPKVTIWTDEGAVSSGELLIDLKNLKKNARTKLSQLKKEKAKLLKKSSDIQKFLDKEKVVDIIKKRSEIIL